MEHDTFYEIWESTIDRTALKNYSKLYKTNRLLLKILEECNNPKTHFLILNSFLNFCIENKFNIKTIISSTETTPIIIKKLLLNKNYNITEKDENIFLCGQFLFNQSDTFIQKQQNLSNKTYHYFMEKHNIIIENHTFDTLFDYVIKMFPKTKLDTFDSINSYIEKNKTIWNEQIDKFKKKKLPQKYNNQILKSLAVLNSNEFFKNPNNTEPLKHFIKTSKMTISEAYKHKGLMKNFIPWFIKNAEQNTWEEFTQNFEAKDENTKQKIAKELILSKKNNKSTNAISLLHDYKDPFCKMIISNTPNERTLWFNQHYLVNALKDTYIKSIINADEPIPQNLTANNLTLTIWLYEKKLLSNIEYDNLMPILNAYDLDKKINITNTSNKKNKI